MVRADLCVLLRTMLARIAAATTGIDGVDTPERTTGFREYVEQLGTGATVEWSTEDHDEVIRRILAVRDDLRPRLLRVIGSPPPSPHRAVPPR